MLVGSLGGGIPPWDPLGLLSLWDLLWDSSGTNETCVGPHVTRDTHVGLVARGRLGCLVFSWFSWEEKLVAPLIAHLM